MPFIRERWSNIFVKVSRTGSEFCHEIFGHQKSDRRGLCEDEDPYKSASGQYVVECLKYTIIFTLLRLIPNTLPYFIYNMF